jgi:copper chaperone CopZ
MASRIFSVPTISCEHCKQAIESEVRALPDVLLVEVDLPSKTVRVDGEASDESVRAAVEDAGYDVVGSAP